MQAITTFLGIIITQIIVKMLKIESMSSGGCFITQEQFTVYRNEVQREFQALRAILKEQMQQIELIRDGKGGRNEGVGVVVGESYKARLENMELKRKIGELQATIEEYERKSKDQAVNQTTSLGQAYEKNYEKLQMQETTSKLSLSAEFFTDSLEEKTGNDESSKFLLGNRLTKETEEQLQEDDDEEIECIWDERDKKDLKSTILNNENHHHNPHNREFRIETTDGKVSITKASGNGFLCPAHSFIYKDSLGSGVITRFSVKAIKIRDIFMVGIGSINTFGVENAFRHSESLVYSSKGDLWSKGDSRRLGRSIGIGQEVQITVDRGLDIVFWSMKDVQIGRAQIPPCMANKEMYLIVMMFNKDDTVHLCEMQ